MKNYVMLSLVCAIFILFFGSFCLLKTAEFNGTNITQYGTLLACYEPSENLQKTFTLHYNNNAFCYAQKEYKNFYLNAMQQQRLAQIKSVGIRQTYVNLLNQNYSEIDALDYIYTGFKNWFSNIKNSIEKEYVPTLVHFNPNSKNMFSATCGQDGVSIDTKSLALDIISGKQDIIITTITTPLEITEQEALENTCLRSKQSTSFANSEAGRRFNVIKAMQCFNGLVVAPDEEVSFSSTLNKNDNGVPYKEATVIVNGEFTKGVGGGICQASTTIFNAVLMAGLMITESHPHSLPVGYVERGFDATVNGTNLDLKFKNNTKHNIYIKTYTQNSNVVCEVYGEDMQGVTYEKQNQVTKIEPPAPKVIPDEKGEYQDKITYRGEYYTKLYAQYGYHVKAYLVKRINGIESEKWLIRQATYAPTQSIIYEGIQEKEQ